MYTKEQLKAAWMAGSANCHDRDQPNWEQFIAKQPIQEIDHVALLEWATKQGWRGHHLGNEVAWLNIKSNLMINSERLVKLYQVEALNKQP